MPKKKHQPAGVGMTPSTSEFGNFIRVRRLELDLRQAPLANEVGLAQTSLSAIEVGKSKYLNDYQLERLTKALRCDVEELRKRMPVKRIAQPTTELGRLIRSRREELGISLSAFAKKVNMTPRQALSLEIRNLSIRHSLVQPLATTLDLDHSVLGKFAGITRKETVSKLGQLIRSRRKELGMNLDVLAEKLNVSPQFVSKIEFGQCRLSESGDRIAQLAQILELDVNKLEALRPIRRMKQIGTTSPLGGFLAAKRLELRLSQREVGRRAEIHHSAVSRVETGKLQPGLNLLDKLAKALGCSIPAELIPTPDRQASVHVLT